MTRVLMKGTEAIAEAAIQAGCKYFFGYPITPQNEIPEYMSAQLPEIGGQFVHNLLTDFLVSLYLGVKSTELLVT